MKSMQDLDLEVQKTNEDLAKAKQVLYNSLVNIDLNHVEQIHKSSYGQQQMRPQSSKISKSNIDYALASQKYKPNKRKSTKSHFANSDAILQERRDLVNSLDQILDQKDQEIMHLQQYVQLLQYQFETNDLNSPDIQLE